MCVVILISDLPPTESCSIYHHPLRSRFFFIYFNSIVFLLRLRFVILVAFFFLVYATTLPPSLPLRLSFSISFRVWMCLVSSLHHYFTFNRFSGHCLHSLCLLFSKENNFSLVTIAKLHNGLRRPRPENEKRRRDIAFV